MKRASAAGDEHIREDLGSADRVVGQARLQVDFDVFLRAVGLIEIPEHQYIEMRRAFFAGAWSVLCEESRVPLDALRAECEEFSESVLNGHA